MAFTPFERQLAAQYFAQYGGKLPGGEYSETAIQDFMLADEAGRRTVEGHADQPGNPYPTG